MQRRGQLGELLRIFRECDPLWMITALAMVVPLTLLTARRLQILAPPRARMSFGEATRLILTASTLNLILPSKMGDLAKAWFMKKRGQLDGSLAFALVVFEKGCDMLSLLAWCVFGLLLYPAKDGSFLLMTIPVSAAFLLGLLLLGARRLPLLKSSRLTSGWSEMHDFFWSKKTRLLQVAALSVFIWFLHLLQIWMFIRALRAHAPFVQSLALSPLALLAGLLPLTFAGIGTRDAALVFLYQRFFAAPTAAALGLLCTMRYLLPALAGLPFLSTARATLRSAPESRW